MLVSLIAAACKALRDWLRVPKQADLLTLDNHMLADIGLRRADLHAGLWQPSGLVDGDASTSRRWVPPKDFAADWPLF